MKCCGNCGWAAWEKTKNGRRNPNRPGKCMWPEPVRKHPSCVREHDRHSPPRTAIWPKYGKDCECHQEG